MSLFLNAHASPAYAYLIHCSISLYVFSHYTKARKNSLHHYMCLWHSEGAHFSGKHYNLSNKTHVYDAWLLYMLDTNYQLLLNPTTDHVQRWGTLRKHIVNYCIARTRKNMVHRWNPAHQYLVKKFYWNRATLICLCIDDSCFHTTKAEFCICSRDCMV